ncbi:MAG: crotonase/enoyl-CoA hydratase family protein [Candidatus Azotimanducaceae bacterium]|uniref:Crotonase/enoyl-CoA hydratase family protein n=1 Tax=OM182 bacterium TaxID=2510334 RepID=A0A520RXB8_9GAMM|nr:enoyl-CoA hydratase [Gammaproteobacteria bacterium]RZO74892.1 MAG: crotonase/enoyl-CoA hydratase family protein [OM182 bacterium]
MANVVYETQGDIATITMNDGKANAINSEMIEEINAGLDRAERDMKAVIITGRSGIFCGGFDLRVIQSGDIKQRREQFLAGAKLAMRLYGFPRPVIAAVTGSSVALGGFLLLTADYRIGISGEFKIGLNEVAIGMSLPPFALMLAESRINARHLTNATLSATLYSPEEAIAVGFLDEVTEPNDLLRRSKKKAETLAKLDADAFSQVKLDIRGAGIQRILEELSDA